MALTSEDWRSSSVKRVEVGAIAAIGYPLINALGRTLRWRVDGLHHLDAIRASGRQPIMAFWHGRILGAAFYFRHRGIVVLTSENFDGEWIGRIIRRLGYRTIRGSSSHGGSRALLQLRREMAKGRAAGFTLDGPRGPAEQAHPGAIWLAGATGNPIVPFHLESARCLTVRSWDRTQVPYPFSLMALAVGAPIDVPPDANEAALEAKRVEVESSLTALRQRALEMLGSRR
jgi:lysophospholipid acyltransferase (LPLAT)-like uncharacterized protein